jgi:hypothetical protein
MMTSIPITPELREQLAAHPGQPIRMFDESTGKMYYLVEESNLERATAALVSEAGRSDDRLRELIQEGLDGPFYEEEEADRIIDTFLQDHENVQ